MKRATGGIWLAALALLPSPAQQKAPGTARFRTVQRGAERAGGKKLLVHCQANLRGAPFTYLYRAIHEGATASDVSAKLAGVWVPNAAWRKFIEDTMSHYGKKAELD
jgi:hypothetical protein